MAKGDGNSSEAKFSRYLIYATEDGGLTLNLAGEMLARGSEEALRKFFSEPLLNRTGDYCAISENARRIRRVQATVKTSISDVDGAAAFASEPAQEELVQP